MNEERERGEGGWMGGDVGTVGLQGKCAEVKLQIAGEQDFRAQKVVAGNAGNKGYVGCAER